MKYIEQHIQQANSIAEAYKGQEPLHLYLKKFFKRNKKFGSRDRKSIASYLYGAYRMGRENRHLSMRQRVYFYLFLSGEGGTDLFADDFADLQGLVSKPFREKIEFLRSNYELRETYRAQDEISTKINSEEYRNSFYTEPRVYIRLRNESAQNYEKVIAENEGEELVANLFAFPPQIKLHSFLAERDYVVQDVNSQRTAQYFPVLGETDEVWDCCAGSGGKSILLLDAHKNLKLTVTDIRASILRSLLERFELYGLEAEMVAELNINKAKELQILEDRFFDFIICDVPCTGSGTWARTPEQFYFFEKKEIGRFQKRQLDILENASSRLKKSGVILYITCSVFAKENEEVINLFLQKHTGFKIEEQEYLDGTSSQADTLFVTKLVK
jgi:16S rRNA (cytosine967-C5)-methyltransferase